jgi:hypothetical protein
LKPKGSKKLASNVFVLKLFCFISDIWNLLIRKHKNKIKINYELSKCIGNIGAKALEGSGSPR